MSVSHGDLPASGHLTIPASNRTAGGTGHLTGDGERPRSGWDMGPWLGLAQQPYGQARQGCGELEIGPTVASAGQGLMTLRG